MSAYGPGTRMTIETLRRMFVAHGSHPTTATQQAHVLVWGMVQRQAAMVAYLDVFRVLALLLLLAIPLVFLLKKPVHQIRRVGPVVE